MIDSYQYEYDQRQYALMTNALVQYEKGEINLPSLISGLEALLAALTASDEDWNDSFRSEWWILENIYAVAMERNQQELSPQDEGEIAKAILAMKKLVDARVSPQEDGEPAVAPDRRKAGGW